ncbi:MAG: DUF2934 domain-containing protein [Methanocellales archaeon]|nr:DUF2934 domain-containing protein [Methanocellales archaeon]
MRREEEIRLIAYSIWEQEGFCDGRDIEHWLRAEAIWEEKQKCMPQPESAKAEAVKATARQKSRAAKKK